jgi:hypothetical protein
MAGGKTTTRAIIWGLYGLATFATVQAYHYVDQNILAELRSIYSTVSSEDFERQLTAGSGLERGK